MNHMLHTGLIVAGGAGAFFLVVHLVGKNNSGATVATVPGQQTELPQIAQAQLPASDSASGGLDLSALADFINATSSNGVVTAQPPITIASPTVVNPDAPNTQTAGSVQTRNASTVLLANPLNQPVRLNPGVPGTGGIAGRSSAVVTTNNVYTQAAPSIIYSTPQNQPIRPNPGTPGTGGLAGRSVIAAPPPVIDPVKPPAGRGR
jgi:hypothetical protein